MRTIIYPLFFLWVAVVSANDRTVEEFVTIAGSDNLAISLGVRYPSNDVISASALKPFDGLVKTTTKSTLTFESVVLESKEDIDRVTTKFNKVSGEGWGSSASASRKYIDELRSNRTDFTYYIGAVYERGRRSVLGQNQNRLQLTNTALSILANDGAKAFIDTYGSYVLIGLSYGGFFNASHHIQTRSVTEKNTLIEEAKASIGLWNSGKIEADHQYEETATNVLENTKKRSTLVASPSIRSLDNTYQETFNDWIPLVDAIEPLNLEVVSGTAIPWINLPQVQGIGRGEILEWSEEQQDFIIVDEVAIPADFDLIKLQLSSGLTDAIRTELSALRYLVENVETAIANDNYIRVYLERLQALKQEALNQVDEILALQYEDLLSMSASEFNHQYRKSNVFKIKFKTMSGDNQALTETLPIPFKFEFQSSTGEIERGTTNTFIGKSSAPPVPRPADLPLIYSNALSWSIPQASIKFANAENTQSVCRLMADQIALTPPNLEQPPTDPALVCEVDFSESPFAFSRFSWCAADQLHHNNLLRYHSACDDILNFAFFAQGRLKLWLE